MLEAGRRHCAGFGAPSGPCAAALARFRGRQGPHPCKRPDHAYYAQVKERIDGNRAALSGARKIVRQAVHVLAEFGDGALAAC
jgi:hypothetical protein